MTYCTVVRLAIDDATKWLTVLAVFIGGAAMMKLVVGLVVGG